MTEAKKSKVIFGDAWPDEVVGYVAEYLDHNDLHALEATCRCFQRHTRDGGYWRQSVVKAVSFPRPPRTTCNIQDWKAFACANHLMVGNKTDSISLLHDVAGYSSVDREKEESADNTLHPSLCFREMVKYKDPGVREFANDRSLFDYTIQRLVCGCSMGQCYWSSGPSRDPNSDEFIDYMVRGSCILKGLQIVPYRASWQLGQPTYAPRQVSLSILSTADAVVYSSPRYDIKNAMELQCFELPQCVFLQDLAWRVRFSLHGKHQYQLDDDEQEGDADIPEDRRQYYCCMSFISLNGVLH
ncbi:hypothetical protein SPRG_09855 [Saprolegnia parasitica CBS 223.65]|uniref:F-box domain-containing protein n=1 Tax=Saprolegnia parasitica (strain CBS 223.65) TaxID=695850 RepID=A0A067CCH8_SAPPC|nr:hypothetical protein SPRG_09855 [Saprolegnia parasitica CBS 223.65]KDO24221.1 hypothetical protein SPRG_09855 [Saprolegnia parasitica CBS 223.65]|eukprot:XP_012204998.1 hypothetical protein SPRG_09855 [Saprolegnia parasitica CBS 223.65]